MSLMDRCLTKLIEGTVRKKNKVRYVGTVRFNNWTEIQKAGTIRCYRWYGTKIRYVGTVRFKN